MSYSYTMRFTVKITLFLSTLFVLQACKKEATPPTDAIAFELSDTMLKTTTFAKASMQPLRNELKYYGKIATDNNKTIEVYPVVGGNVTKVYVELGDYVQKGQLMATIRSTEVADFEKQLEDAKNDVIVAKNNLKVTQELFDGKLNSERDVIEAKSILEKSNSQLFRMQETFNIYNIRKGSIYEVRAPLSGFITQKVINESMLLRNDHTDNIFDIAQINDVWAIANVTESDINEIKVGEMAQITTLSYPDKVFQGKVDKIFNIIDPDTKAMKVLIKLGNPGFLLKPEMRASIKISYVEKNSQMIAVPSTAVIFDKSRNYVMVYKDKSHIETRPVVVLRQVGDTAYIQSGLEVGDQVMTHNQLLVYDALND